jgi:hypothetical protein
MVYETAQERDEAVPFRAGTIIKELGIKPE